VHLLADSLKSEHLAEDLAGKIAVKSDGNPYFVFEILRGLREGQFLARKPTARGPPRASSARSRSRRRSPT